MKRLKLNMLIFMALCCSLGLFVKKLVNPLANVITEALHIPGGISTGFSIMFLVVAAEIVRMKKCGTMMGAVQGFLALALGRIGSMGVLAPLGYFVPGITIDIVYFLQKYLKLSRTGRMMLANGLAAVMASVTANLLVFHLKGIVLLLYLCVSLTSGSIYGYLGALIVPRIYPVYQQYGVKEEGKTYEKA